MTTPPTTRNSSTALPESEAPRHAIFATTHWSLILKAGQRETPQAKVALEKLCQIYWQPLFAYARRRGYSPSDAEDMTQAFFAWLLARDWLAGADQERGRFRSFLLTSFSRFLANEWDKANAQKRGGGQVISMHRDGDENGHDLEPVNHFTPEQQFEWRWAVTLLDQVMNTLSAEYYGRGKKELFDELKPCLLGDREAQPYAALALKLNMSEGSVKVAVHRLRQQYRQVLRDEIAHTVATPEEIEDEMRYLFAVLARR